MKKDRWKRIPTVDFPPGKRQPLHGGDRSELEVQVPDYVIFVGVATMAGFEPLSARQHYLQTVYLSLVKCKAV
jgi:hypothetical protein